MSEPRDEYKHWLENGRPEAVPHGHKYAIATPGARGWRRVPDTEFSHPANAHQYGMKYHSDSSGTTGLFRVIKHPNSTKETAAAKNYWWKQLTPEARKEYIEAHPNTTMPHDTFFEPDEANKKYITPLAGSEHSFADVRKHFNFMARHGHESKLVSVHPDNFRATQRGLRHKSKPKSHLNREVPDKDAKRAGRLGIDPDNRVRGIRTPDGNVHILDGHHRAFSAHQQKTPLNVHVYDLSPEQMKKNDEQKARESIEYMKSFDRKAKATASAKNKFPDVHFGPLDKPKLDWRQHDKVDLPDDDRLRETPKSIIKMLGFDPAVMDNKRRQEKANVIQFHPPTRFSDDKRKATIELHHAAHKLLISNGFHLTINNEKGVHGWRNNSSGLIMEVEPTLDKPVHVLNMFTGPSQITRKSADHNQILRYIKTFAEAHRDCSEFAAKYKEGVSAIKYRDKIYELDGMDHDAVIEHIFITLGIDDPAKQDKEVSKMKFGAYDPKTKKFTEEYNDLEKSAVQDKTVCLDTAYLTPALWKKWDALLKSMESELGLKRESVKTAETAVHGVKYTAYKVFYEKPGIKIQREAQRNIRQMWSTFKNPLSRHFK